MTNAPETDDYSPSQLIMISHNRLAQYWEGFGHISHFERVDIDALVQGMATRTTTSAPSMTSSSIVTEMATETT
jgi:hypothetical protein